MLLWAWDERTAEAEALPGEEASIKLVIKHVTPNGSLGVTLASFGAYAKLRCTSSFPGCKLPW